MRRLEANGQTKRTLMAVFLQKLYYVSPNTVRIMNKIAGCIFHFIIRLHFRCAVPVIESVNRLIFLSDTVLADEPGLITVLSQYQRIRFNERFPGKVGVEVINT